MLFQTIEFAVFFFLLVAVVLLTRSNFSRKTCLLVFSYAFYMFWNPAFILLLLSSTVFNFWTGHAISTSSRKKQLLIFSIIVNLALLAYFKYFHFLEDNLLLLLRLFGQQPSWAATNIFLPIGISFYTFEVISYNVDIYKGEIKPAKQVVDFALFLAFFPRLVAGPILRPDDFLEQLKEKKELDPEPRYLLLFIKGMFKKMIIADNLSLFADQVLDHPGNFPSMIIWVGVLCFTIQIYCDFSGYSDMAIALASFFGYTFPRNFDRPYFAVSPSEFWSKWHISLSSWLRDYLYIPLGGNRHGSWGTYRNMMLTMLIGGLWHGASWNFVAWGALHGGIQVIYRALSLDKKLKSVSQPILLFFAWFAFQYVVWLTWITFRVVDFNQMRIALTKFVCFDFDFRLANIGLGNMSFFSTLFYMIAFVLLHAFSKKSGGVENYLLRQKTWVVSLVLVLVGASFFFLWPLKEAPFIYFQF